MALRIFKIQNSKFDVNYITAVKGKSVNGLKFANVRYKMLISFQGLSFMEE